MVRHDKAARNTTLRPKISDSRPYNIWKVVLATRDAVPAHEMVFSAWRSRAIVGNVTPIPFWSMNEMSCAMASPENTNMSSLVGKMLIWLWSDRSAAC